MQVGDCNAPSMFQRLMTAIFRDCISWFIHVYLDNIFIYLHSIEEHEKHLGIMFQQLRDHLLFLSKSKVDLYSKRLECLSHIIDDWGIHADADKMQCIREWRRPRTFNNVQHFLGLVQYLAHYMPDISKKWPSIWMDALIRKVFWEHQNTSMQGSNTEAYWLW